MTLLSSDYQTRSVIPMNIGISWRNNATIDTLRAQGGGAFANIHHQSRCLSSPIENLEISNGVAGRIEGRRRMQ